MYQAPCKQSLFLQGSLAALMGPGSCQIIALVYPAHCHCLMVEAGLLWYSGSSQWEQKSVEAVYPACQESNTWLPVTFPTWELCHLANPPTAREPGKCSLAEHPRALLQAFSCEGRSQIRWLGFQKSPSQPGPFPPHNNFRPVCLKFQSPPQCTDLQNSNKLQALVWLPFSLTWTLSSPHTPQEYHLKVSKFSSKLSLSSPSLQGKNKHTSTILALPHPFTLFLSN